MTTVSVVVTVVVLALVAAVFAVGIWAIRVQNRQFPEDLDRTGWSPERGHAGWLRTKFTWLSGGRGQRPQLGGAGPLGRLVSEPGRR